jgi:hypothetical protein
MVIIIIIILCVSSMLGYGLYRRYQDNQNGIFYHELDFTIINFLSSLSSADKLLDKQLKAVGTDISFYHLFL